VSVQLLCSTWLKVLPRRHACVRLHLCTLLAMQDVWCIVLVHSACVQTPFIIPLYTIVHVLVPLHAPREHTFLPLHTLCARFPSRTCTAAWQVTRV